jgi:hypothetical protein
LLPRAPGWAGLSSSRGANMSTCTAAYGLWIPGGDFISSSLISDVKTTRTGSLSQKITTDRRQVVEPSSTFLKAALLRQRRIGCVTPFPSKPPDGGFEERSPFSPYPSWCSRCLLRLTAARAVGLLGNKLLAIFRSCLAPGSPG